MPLLEKNPKTTPCFGINDPATIRSAQLVKALAHPVRLAILSLLAKEKNCFCGDFTEVLPLAQSTVSQHLKVLKDTGLVNAANRGVRTCYCLNPEGIKELNHHLKGLGQMLGEPIHEDCR